MIAIMWFGRSDCVVLPTYNERDSIRQVVLDFFDTAVVDEVLVVNNNAVAGRSEALVGSGALEIHQGRQGNIPLMTATQSRAREASR